MSSLSLGVLVIETFRLLDTSASGYYPDEIRRVNDYLSRIGIEAFSVGLKLVGSIPWTSSRPT